MSEELHYFLGGEGPSNGEIHTSKRVGVPSENYVKFLYCF